MAKQTKNSHVNKTAVGVTIIAVFALLTGLLLFFALRKKPLIEPEPEKVVDVADRGPSAEQTIEMNKQAIESGARQILASRGFESDIPLTTGFHYEHGDIVYTCKTTYGNLELSSPSPRLDKSFLHQADNKRIIVGNDSFQDVESFFLTNRLEQCTEELESVYIIYNSDTSLFYVDPLNDVIYSTTYYPSIHTYNTTIKEGGIYENFRHI